MTLVGHLPVSTHPSLGVLILSTRKTNWGLRYMKTRQQGMKIHMPDGAIISLVPEGDVFKTEIKHGKIHDDASRHDYMQVIEWAFNYLSNNARKENSHGK